VGSRTRTEEPEQVLHATYIAHTDMASTGSDPIRWPVGCCLHWSAALEPQRRRAVHPGRPPSAPADQLLFSISPAWPRPRASTDWLLLAEGKN